MTDDEIKAIGYLDVEMLTFLKGQPWDDVAQAYVHALRPSQVRVSTGTLKSDARLWRVTVMTNDEGRITEITQEVEVALPAGIEHGNALARELTRRQTTTIAGRLPDKHGTPSSTQARHMRNAPGTLDVFIKHAQLHGFHDRELAVFRALHVAAHNLMAYLEEPEKPAYADPRTMREKAEEKRRPLEVALIEATHMARMLFGEP